jgi:aminopeptidase
VQDALLRRYAELAVEVGANVQPGQDVAIIAGTSATRLVRAIAAKAYDRGARFVDPWYFDPYVKRIRAERAAEDSLEYVPTWYGERVRQLGEKRGARMHITPLAPPGLMAGVAAERVGRDLLPLVPERFEANRTTNWCAFPWPTSGWAQVVHPEIEPEAALAALIDDVTYVLRLDEADAAAAWRSRFAALDRVARKLNEARLAALRFRGPGTDLTVGLSRHLASRHCRAGRRLTD